MAPPATDTHRQIFPFERDAFSTGFGHFALAKQNASPRVPVSLSEKWRSPPSRGQTNYCCMARRDRSMARWPREEWVSSRCLRTKERRNVVTRIPSVFAVASATLPNVTNFIFPKFTCSLTVAGQRAIVLRLEAMQFHEIYARREGLEAGTIPSVSFPSEDVGIAL